ncbi:ABC transporter permease subunit [Lysinibacillus sp. KU-BSD001]|uniref:ABC transporter permease subunit n=1 Tax=Lysinibacillus sp. KU-BSD001 TaxID=3141328 RepID=UPI0036EE2BAB
MLKTTQTMRLFYVPLLVIFAVFLIVPLAYMLWLSFSENGAFTLQHYKEVFQSSVITSIGNSVTVSLVSAVMTTTLAFIVAYTLYFTTIHATFKKGLRFIITLPMLLPTITYGFVLIYVFGNQGVITRLLGEPLFSIYGFNGLVIGYVLYTLPAAFLLIANGMEYVDQRFMLVSILMNDQPIRRFYHTVLRPLIGTIGGAFILSFILSFTDYGIPASVGGTYEVIATTLYQTMLGSIPNFSQGAVIAVLMLFPAIIGGIMLTRIDKYNVSYQSASNQAPISNKIKNICFGFSSSLVAMAIIIIFSTMFIVPFVSVYPYNMSFTLEHLEKALAMKDVTAVYKNSVIVAMGSAAIGVLIAFVAGVISVRTNVKSRRSLNWISIVTNTVPGMVLGLSYLLFFNDSSLKGTFLILILCNIVHFFTTPYLMMKNALEKMDPTWEVTGALLKDSWLKTVVRVIVPNIRKTIINVFSYYFINAMVTVSGVIFLVSTNTILMSTKIKELQHFSKFNEIFILSLLILFTNIVVMTFCNILNSMKKRSLLTNEQQSTRPIRIWKLSSIIGRMWR